MEPSNPVEDHRQELGIPENMGRDTGRSHCLEEQSTGRWVLSCPPCCRRSLALILDCSSTRPDTAAVCSVAVLLLFHRRSNRHRRRD